MVTIRKTKKLIEASRVLADERFCDTDDDGILRAVMEKKVSSKQVYAACNHFGYRWDSEKRRWKLKYPRWMRKFHEIEEASR